MCKLSKQLRHPKICPESAQQALLLLVISAVLSGCYSIPTRFASGISAEERRLAAQLPVYSEMLAPETFVLVGPVSGISCQITHDDRYRVSRENAIEELKIAALKAGGNAVMGVQCGQLQHRKGARRCFRSIECQGTAIQQAAH
jgi:uncharacterized protein YbjQ (UPF0145 family)